MGGEYRRVEKHVLFHDSNGNQTITCSSQYNQPLRQSSLPIGGPLDTALLYGKLEFLTGILRMER